MALRELDESYNLSPRSLSLSWSVNSPGKEEHNRFQEGVLYQYVCSVPFSATKMNERAFRVTDDKWMAMADVGALGVRWVKRSLSPPTFLSSSLHPGFAALQK